MTENQHRNDTVSAPPGQGDNVDRGGRFGCRLDLQRIELIKVGNRFRKDLGDLTDLCASIRDHGLLEPIVVDSENNLLAGARRLAACKILGHQKIMTHVVTVDWPKEWLGPGGEERYRRKELQIERDENVVRKDFLPSEAVAIADEIERLEKIEAKARQKTSRAKPGEKVGKGAVKLTTPSEKGRAADAAARAVGFSRNTLKKVREIVEAAKTDPKLEPIVKMMDKTCNIESAFRKLRVEKVKKASAIEEHRSELMSDLRARVGRYRTIYVDPPWGYLNDTCQGAASGIYPVMTNEEICALPVSEIAHPDGAHLWMWTTWALIRDKTPHQVLEAWGFKWMGEVLWVKDGLGCGNWIRPSTEILILGVRGKVPPLRRDQRGHIQAARGGHSKKPIEFYPMIETFSPGPRIELFAREARDRWDRWGLEASPEKPPEPPPEPPTPTHTIADIPTDTIDAIAQRHGGVREPAEEV